jgi:hypothetical protein
MSLDIGTNRRSARAITILVIALCLVAAIPDSATAQIRGDFNGDGVGDLAIGTPNESVVARRFINGAFQNVTIAAAGSVTVIFGTAASGVQITAASPRPQLIHQEVSGEDFSETNDQFGAALASGRFNDDDFDDLIVSVPGDNAIHIFHGSNIGLDLTGDRMIDGSQFFDLQGNPKSVTFKPGLARGNFNGDAFDDIAVEATEPAGVGERAAVVVMSGGSSGVSSVSGRIFAFDNSNIAAENPGILRETTLAAGDFTGDGADDLAVGLPDADVLDESGALIFDAGGVFIMRGGVGAGQAGGITVEGATALTERSANSIPRFNERFGLTLAAGDFDGNGVDDLAVGAPQEDVVNGNGTFVQDGGFLAVFAEAATLHGIYTQLPLGLNPQANDRFAGALASADFNSDGADDLAIGTPGDTAGGVAGAGSVTVLFGILNLGLPRPATFGLPQINGTGRTFTQATTDVSDSPESGDQFGLTLSASDVGRSSHPDLIIGVPDEDVVVSLGGNLEDGIQLENRANAGALHVIYGSNAILSGAGSHFVTQNSSSVPDSVEAGDRFGLALP